MDRETCERVVFRIKGKSHSITLYSVTHITEEEERHHTLAFYDDGATAVIIISITTKEDQDPV